MIDSAISSFAVVESELTDEEIEKLISFNMSDLNTEKWEIQISPIHNIINGVCFGKDIGLFYLFLVGEKLDNKIDIIRG